MKNITILSVTKKQDILSKIAREFFFVLTKKNKKNHQKKCPKTKKHIKKIDKKNFDKLIY